MATQLLNREKLRYLAALRLREAHLLYDAGAYSGSYYLVGYAVECALKAVIAGLMRSDEFPARTFAAGIYIHKLDALVGLAGLGRHLEEVSATDEDFRVNWAQTINWTEEARYREFNQDDALNLLTAVADRDHGVMQWISRYW